MKKKLLLLILSILLVLSLGLFVGCFGSPSGENPPTYTSTTGLEYTMSSDGTYYICSGIGTAIGGNIVIGSEYEGLPVKEIKAEAFAYNNAITKVTIPESVEAIGKNAFIGCNLLNYNYSNGGL